MVYNIDTVNARGRRYAQGARQAKRKAGSADAPYRRSHGMHETLKLLLSPSFYSNGYASLNDGVMAFIPLVCQTANNDQGYTIYRWGNLVYNRLDTITVGPMGTIGHGKYTNANSSEAVDYIGYGGYGILDLRGGAGRSRVGDEHVPPLGAGVWRWLEDDPDLLQYEAREAARHQGTDVQVGEPVVDEGTQPEVNEEAREEPYHSQTGHDGAEDSFAANANHCNANDDIQLCMEEWDVAWAEATYGQENDGLTTAVSRAGRNAVVPRRVEGTSGERRVVVCQRCWHDVPVEQEGDHRCWQPRERQDG